LYQADKPLVSLSSEIEHIKDYLALEKMRYGSNLLVDLDLPENMEDISIAPMLFIPLVENSFKHGQFVDKKLSISIQLKINENRIEFTIENSVKSTENPIIENGIGLSNLEKRLELLYPDHHTLSVNRNSSSFEAQLSLIHSKIHQHV
jgi:LytS/YehU family sensor histidine kinase